MKTKLNEQDRERIKQEACNQIPHGYQYWSPFIRGTEYATIYTIWLELLIIMIIAMLNSLNIIQQ